MLWMLTQYVVDVRCTITGTSGKCTYTAACGWPVGFCGMRMISNVCVHSGLVGR
jgi:hypothetical protein